MVNPLLLVARGLLGCKEVVGQLRSDRENYSINIDPDCVLIPLQVKWNVQIIRNVVLQVLINERFIKLILNVIKTALKQRLSGILITY